MIRDTGWIRTYQIRCSKNHRILTTEEKLRTGTLQIEVSKEGCYEH